MNLAQLLSKRLIFVSGKGGVGKTSVAVLLGLLSTTLKKKTLLVELNSSGRIAPIFKGIPTPHDITELAPNLSAINLLPKDCFEEYVLMHVKFKSIYQVFFNNKFVTNFLGATPGLNELLMLGKVFDLERQTQGKKSEDKLFDLVIVDMPATGHGLSAMEVPHILESAVKMGPLHNNAVKMNKLFADASRTAFCLVTLAEEMPVCETKEFENGLKEKTDLHFGPLFVNAIMSDVPKVKPPSASALDEDSRLYWDYYKLARDRAKLNDHYLKEIETEFSDFEKIILPYRFEGLESPKDFSEMAKTLKEAYL